MKLSERLGSTADAAPRKSLASSALGGLVWLTLQSFGSRLISLLTQLALAWLLSPANFGVIGLVYVLTNISNALVNFGVDNVMMQRQRTLRLWMAPAFCTSLGLSLVGFAIVIVLAPISASLYKTPQLIPLASILALSLPIGALTTVPSVLIRSRMDFRFISIYNVIDFTVSQIATVFLAWRGFGAYSFVIPTPILALVRVIVFWVYSPATILHRFRLNQIGFILRSGSAVFATRFIIETISQGDYAILGLTASKAQVGVYYFAFRLAAQPIWIIAGNFTGVLLPALMKLKTDSDRQLSATLTAGRLLAYITIPACFLQSALADPLLRLLFGVKWLGAIPVMQVLSVGLALDAITWVTGTFLSAKREYFRALIYYAAFAPFFFVFVFIGSRAAQATGAAFGVTGFYLLMGPLMAYLVLSRYGVSARHVIALFVKPMLIAGSSFGAAAALSFLPLIINLQLLRLVEIVTIGPLLYLALMRQFEPATLFELFDRVLPGRGVKRVVDRLLGEP